MQALNLLLYTVERARDEIRLYIRPGLSFLCNRD